MGFQRAALWQPYIFVICLCLKCILAYSPGDIVPTSRRGQYHGMRTEWHDTLGKYCPRFRVNHEVVLPIPRPVGFSSNEAYKLSLMIGKERYTTPWLLVFGLPSGKIPMVDIVLTHFVGELRGVSTKVVTMPDEYVAKHPSVAAEYHNMTHWPKHILLRYSWNEQAEVDVTAGLFVLFGTGFLLTTILSLFILQSSKEKISRFVNQQMVETSIVSSGEIAKVD